MPTRPGVLAGTICQICPCPGGEPGAAVLVDQDEDLVIVVLTLSPRMKALIRPFRLFVTVMILVVHIAFRAGVSAEASSGSEATLRSAGGIEIKRVPFPIILLSSDQVP